MSALSSLPARHEVTGRLLSAVVVGLTLYVVDGSLSVAAGSAVLFAVFTLCIDTTEAVVGDYADNLALGVLTLCFTAYLAVTAWWTPLVATGTLLGGWFLVDGVQHLRHGVTRDEVTWAYDHDGGLASGLARALVARLFEPFRL